jgi:hypothetical protein
MAKKLAVGRRKRAMAGKASATKRELIEAGTKKLPAKIVKKRDHGSE